MYASSFIRSMTSVLILSALVLIVLPLHPRANDDPYLWLEELEGDQALEWVMEQSRETKEKLSSHTAFDPLRDRMLAILNSDERIPFPAITGDYLYNFWQDTENPRGIWRRTTWDAYIAGDTEWETVLDIDALANEENVNWAFKGSTCLPPEYRRCLIRLSRGGADAVEIREFDAGEKTFIDGGFFLPEAKQNVTWLDEDRLLVATDFGEGSLTTSGYARIAKVWERGDDLSDAETLFEGESSDVSVSVGRYRTSERNYAYVLHRPSFFQTKRYIFRNGDLIQLELPVDASPTLMADRLIVRLRSSWDTGGNTYRQGSLLAIGMDEFLEGNRNFEVILVAGERESIRGVTATRHALLVNLLDNVRAELRRYTYDNGRWDYDTIEAPEFGTVSFAATSPLTDRFFFMSSGFTQPTTLYVAEPDGSSRIVRSLPEMFDAGGLVVDQRTAISKDDTRIPYFIVYDKNIEYDGSNPTLLSAYGGFEISRTPGYSGTLGAAWLERGGVYVVANIRGGGEFGPDWHRSAQRENRQRAFDDFIAVAENLIEQGITSPHHLGIQGGSNGGLLVGAAFTQRPDLFGAVVCAVPLLDMRRYHTLLAGASWMAEYGNPDDPDDWAFIREYSPYHNLDEDEQYPRVLFTTTTRDDRVHPGHARKMAAKMEDMGNTVFYFENTEGGHGAGVTNEQRALMNAITYTYLWNELRRDYDEAMLD